MTTIDEGLEPGVSPTSSHGPEKIEADDPQPGADTPQGEATRRPRGRPPIPWTREQKVFAVRMFARYATPLEVAKAFEQRWGRAISRQSAERYNPDAAAGSGMPADLREIFDAERKAYRESWDDVPEAALAVRIRRYAEAAEAFRRRGDYVNMNKSLESLARDMGGAFSNRRELTGADGKPLAFQQVAELSDEQLARRVALIADRLGLSAPPPSDGFLAPVGPTIGVIAGSEVLEAGSTDAGDSTQH